MGGDGPTMGRLPENPLTRSRQVGTMCAGPKPNQRQLPRFTYSLRDVHAARTGQNPSAPI